MKGEIVMKCVVEVFIALQKRGVVLKTRSRLDKGLKGFF